MYSRTRRKLLVVTLTVLVMALVLVFGYRGLFPSGNGEGVTNDRSPSEPLLGVAPKSLAPGVHLLGGCFPAAVYAVETSEGLVLINSGIESDASLVLPQMQALGLNWKDLRAILLTHVHQDHSGGARYLREQTGAKVYAGSGDSQALRSGGPREAYLGWLDRPERRIHATPVDVELQGDGVITIGETTFRALAAPGHTPGGICYLMERGNLRALFAGDVIMCLSGDPYSPPRTSHTLGTYPAYLPPRYSGSAASFLTTLQRLRALPVPDLVLPGHPRIDHTPASPRLSQRGWQTLLDGGIHEMETLLARQKKDGLHFLDGTPRRLLPGLYYLGDFAGSAVYGFVTPSRFVLVGSPRKSGLAAFVNRQLRRLEVTPPSPTVLLLTSCDAEDLAGLKDFLETTRAEVVAPQGAEAKVLAACPPGTTFVAAEKLPDRGWFQVNVIPLRGPLTYPAVYQLAWEGKSVLFSGRIPMPLRQSLFESLEGDFNMGRANTSDFFDALNRLGSLKPDLWLPAIPWDCQNVTLYESEWTAIIDANRRFRDRGFIEALPR